MGKRQISVIPFEVYLDKRGELVSIPFSRKMPFEIKRIFYIYGNKFDRGGHAHKKCEQVLIPLSEIIRVYINGQEFLLSSPRYGLYIPPGLGITMKFDPGAILLVLASEEYDPDDYIQ